MMLAINGMTHTEPPQPLKYFDDWMEISVKKYSGDMDHERELEKVDAQQITGWKCSRNDHRP